MRLWHLSRSHAVMASKTSLFSLVAGSIPVVETLLCRFYRPVRYLRKVISETR